MTPEDLLPLLIIVEGEPQGKGRPRASSIGGFVRMYTPVRTKAYEDVIISEARACMGARALMAGPVAIEMEIYHSVRKSWTKAKKAAARLGTVVPTIKPDFDNVAKVFCDALNGVVWVDDTQVITATVHKKFADEPCVLLRVIPLDLQSA